MAKRPTKKGSPAAQTRSRSKPSRKLLAWWKRLTDRGLAYWLLVAALIGAGTLVGKICEDRDWALQERYWVYQMLLYATPWKARADHTAVVLIKDKEYWDKLQGREPISRHYLAELIRGIDACDPQLIAVDFNLEIPPRDREDADLVKVIQDISQRRPIVLPVTLEPRGELEYQLKPQIYSGQKFPNSVRTGHINIYKDVRPIPVGLRLIDKRRQESFTEAIVNLVDSRLLKGFQSDEEQPFATFLPRTDIREVDATSVIEGRSRGPLGSLYGKIVIVSGDWDTHRLDHRHIDDQITPAGVLPGSFVQANYVEALLSSRTYRELPLAAAIVLEVLLSTTLVVLFSLNKMSWPKFIALVISAVVIGYFLLENAGRFYDFYFPVLLVASHGAYEQIKEMWARISPKEDNMTNKRKHLKGLTTALIACVSIGEIADKLPRPVYGMESVNPAYQVTLAQNYSPKRRRALIGTTGPRFFARGALAGVDFTYEAFVVQGQDGKRITVLIDDQTQFFVGNKRISFLQLRPGTRVSVKFFQAGSVLVADAVDIQ